jgi:hypothetical protein
MEELTQALHRIERIDSFFYYHLVTATLNHFGADGEMTVRQATRRYGRWRGTEMREAHLALGKPIHMETLMRNWDAASVVVAQDSVDEGSFSPHLVVHDVNLCLAADLWRGRGFHRWGHVYCDEFHQSCASAYHPDGHVVIPENKMKGDKMCKFRWVMPPTETPYAFPPPTELGKKLAKDYRGSDEKERAFYALKRGYRLVGAIYQAFALQLASDFGPQGNAPLSNALRAWGADRGRMMREQHLKSGLEAQPVNMFRFSDLPDSFVCDVRERNVDAQACTIEVQKTPVLESLSDYGLSHLAEPFYREVYGAMASAYRSGLKNTLVSCTPKQVVMTFRG